LVLRRYDLEQRHARHSILTLIQTQVSQQREGHLGSSRLLQQL